MSNELTRLWKFIVDHYNLDELRTLCFELGVDYEDLDGEGKSAKARELLLRVGREQQFDKLLSTLDKLRPTPFRAQFRIDDATLQALYDSLPGLEEEPYQIRVQTSSWVTQLTASIFLQGLGYVVLCLPITLTMGNPYFDKVVLFICIALCYPFLFGPHALYGFLQGIRLENKKIKRLAIIAGISSVLFWSLPVGLQVLRFAGLGDEVLELMKRALTAINPEALP